MYTWRLVVAAVLVVVWYKQLVAGSDVVASASCNRRPPSVADCISSYAGPCHITLANGEHMDIADRGIAPK